MDTIGIPGNSNRLPADHFSLIDATSAVGLGNVMPNDSNVSTKISEITKFRYHLVLAGIICHGA